MKVLRIIRRIRYTKYILPSLTFYILLSIFIFDISRKKFLKYGRYYANDNYSKSGIHPRHNPWMVFDPCSKDTLENMGQPNYVCSWLRDRTSDQTGNFVIFGKELAQLQNVIIDPDQAEGHPGGENMTLVLNQNENSEYLKLNQSYFKLRCAKMLAEPFNRPNSHLNDWMRSYVCSDDLVGHSSSNVITEMTIAIQRYEYVNLYHTMTDYYNAFLVMLLFQKRPENVNILFIDGHPNGGLDDTWRRLFKQTYRAGALKRKTLFSNLIWGIPGYNSPLNNHELTFVPYLKDFRTFFLRQHNLKNISKTLDCDNLSVLFIWRRDYVAHPRNPSGLVSRKIKNEQELVDHVSKLLPGHDIKSLQLDKLTMQEQLKIVSKTDILIGMHGAGLSHTLFLPNHSGLIELYPIYWPETNRHFRMMATWRGLHYLTWKNHDTANEFPLKFTYVPPQSVGNMVNEMAVKLCQNKLRIR